MMQYLHQGDMLYYPFQISMFLKYASVSINLQTMWHSFFSSNHKRVWSLMKNLKIEKKKREINLQWKKNFLQTNTMDYQNNYI